MLVALVEIGVLVQVTPKVLLHRQTVERVKSQITTYLRSHETLALQACREPLGTMRKYMLPLLYYLDEVGVTRRIGDDRVLRRNT